MKQILVVLVALLIPAASWAKPCGHLSQLAGALSCMREVANELPNANREPLVYVSASERAFDGIKKLVADYRGGDMPLGTKRHLIRAAQTSEWAGVVIEMQDEPIFHYYLMESGNEPVKVLSFNPSDAGSIYFPGLYAAGDIGPFVLNMKGMEDWIYEMFKEGMR